MEKLIEAVKLTITPSVSNLLIFTVTFLIIAYWKQKQQRIHKLSENIPGPKGWPFIGNALDFIGSPHGIEIKIIKSSTLKFKV